MIEGMKMNNHDKVDASFDVKIVELEKELNISLVLVTESAVVNTRNGQMRKHFLLDAAFCYKGKRVSGSYIEAISIKESLHFYANKMFNECDNNRFFEYREKKEKKCTKGSLLFLPAQDENLYISRIQARTIVTGWYQLMIGFSLNYLMEQKHLCSKKAITQSFADMTAAAGADFNKPVITRTLIQQTIDEALQGFSSNDDG